jgi:hypothetical protein
MLSFALLPLAAANAPMNGGGTYTIANPRPGVPPEQPAKHRGEYFELLGPPKSGHYGDVNWHPETMQLPADLIKRFDGQVMAVTGMESDIVTVNPDGSHTSIPCTEHYNHHFSGSMSGKAATRVELDSAAYIQGADGYLPGLREFGMQPEQQGVRWEINATLCNLTGRWQNKANHIYVDIAMTSERSISASCEGSIGWKDAAGNLTAPTSAHPQGGLSFWHRGDTSLEHAVLGASSAANAPRCSEITFSAQNKWCREPYCGTGDAPTPQAPAIPHVQSFSEGNGNEHRVSFHGYAKGYAQLIHSPTSWTNNPMIINTNKKLTSDVSPGPIGGPTPRNSLAPPHADYQAILECPCTTKVEKIIDGYKVQAHGGQCAGTPIESASECMHAAASAGMLPIVGNTSGAGFGCHAKLGDAGWELTIGGSAACGAKSSAQAREGMTMFAATGVAVRVAVADANVKITLEGNASAWFGVGFDAHEMADLPWAIIVDGSGAVSERRLARHAGGTLLPAHLTVISSTVVSGRRTVVVSRPRVGDPFSFSLVNDSLPLISAVGTGPTFGMHRARAPGALSLLQPSSAVCLCRDPSANSGTINGLRFNPGACAPFPKSELLSGPHEGSSIGQRDAVCNISAYGGGLYCCHDKVNLLDADQQVNPKTDTFRMKYRFYFEEYTNQRDAFRVWWSTEATNNEYDVPKSTANCLDASTPAEECTHIIKSKFKGRDFVTSQTAHDVEGNIEQDGGWYQLIYAAFHCHAPACISGELWNDDTGELLCRNTAEYGNGTSGSDVMQERGYVVGIPPCVWGTEEEGLHTPPMIHLDTNLSTVKRSNSTNGHWGVMALWQCRGVYANHSQQHQLAA